MPKCPKLLGSYRLRTQSKPARNRKASWSALYPARLGGCWGLHGAREHLFLYPGVGTSHPYEAAQICTCSPGMGLGCGLMAAFRFLPLPGLPHPQDHPPSALSSPHSTPSCLPTCCTGQKPLHWPNLANAGGTYWRLTSAQQGQHSCLCLPCASSAGLCQ